MTWPVLLLVLFGALLHASWNALVKSSSDKTLDTALIHVLCSLLALPVCLYVGPPPAESWPYILGSLVVHVGYYFALAGAYRHGELGLTYPLMRGTAPMLVALTSFAFIGEDLTPLAWLGVACISGGVLLLGITREWWTHRKAIVFALINAVLIAIYTVIDAKGARISGHVVQYICMLFVLDGWPFAILVFMQRKGQVWPYVRKRWPVASGGAFASIGSYAIALWAMTVAPVAMVAALRETSVFFAALIGAWFLKEVWTRQRIAGTVAILSGVAALRLG
ncbi:MAG: DMT family transporter [Burkholderiales bacterium]|jgi:phosphonate utilization associated putative membrane protein|nr:DMT family transporter [Limnohabitans sp.]MCF8181861.1 DMT family transporter [Burkholderiaceae bacterium]